MYAVGKVLYTVAGPFHPFGGAVDIVVVQQQDGSFKSSPWYVRFGKFQGVLKTREKVVNIAVNGIQAGFHMYLDSNGEAHFLRDADSNIEEGDFVVSPASSGDEREAPMQDAQLRKSKSTSCDISTMEADVGDGKTLARTTTRRSTILERMFGRKSIKNNAHAVDRVSSIERAEIAAELLDTKWSTNLSRGSKACSSNDEPSSSHLTDAGYVNQVETTQMVLPDCSFDHDKTKGPNHDSVSMGSNFGSPHGGRRSSGDDNEHYVQTTSVKEDIVEINEYKTGDLIDGITATTVQPKLESLPNDLSIDNSINESIDTQGKLQGNSEDVTEGGLFTKEVLSHGIFEIHAIETDITNGESEAISQFVAVDSDGVNQNFSRTNSPTYSIGNLSSKKLIVSDGITSATDLRGSESLSNDLSTDNSINESIDTQGELWGNSEDVTEGGLLTTEVHSHGIFQIHAIKIDITNRESEAISQFVAVDSDGVDQNFSHTNSPTYTTKNLSSEKHDVSDGITSATDLRGSESWSNDPSTGNSINESVDTQGELQGNSEDVTEVRLFTKEVHSHGIFEIHAIGTDITNRESEAISQFIAVDSDGVDQNFSHTKSPTYTTRNLSSEKHDVSDGITSATDLRGSESLSNDLSTGNSINESIDTLGEFQGNSEDVTEGGLFTKEVRSHGIFQIHAIETDITNMESGAISQFVAVDSDGVDQNFSHTNSPTYTTRNLSSEKHDVSDGITSATDLRGSEALSNDLGNDKGINQSIDTHGEMLSDSEDFTGREMHKKEVLSHGIFEIHAIQTDITNVNSGLISQFVAVDSDGVDQNFTCTNSPPYIGTALSSERHGVSWIASSQDACQEKVVILSSSETLESSYVVPNILPDKVCDDVGISLVDGVRFEDHSRVSSEKIKQITYEERPLGGHGASSNKDSMHNLDVRDQEVSVFDDPSSQSSICDVPNKDISVDTIANGHVICSDHGSGIDISVTTIANDHSTHSAQDLACQHDLVHPDASSSVVEILRYVHEDDPDNVMKYSTVKTKTCNGELDVSVTQTSTMEDGTTECIAQSANLSNKVENEVLPAISDFSSLSKVEEENTKLEDDKNRSSSSNGVEIGRVAEEPRDEAEAVVSFSESVEDIQFQFSDTGNFIDRKTVDDVIANKAAGAGGNDESDGDAEEKGGDETDLGNKLETRSGLSGSETSLILIPGSELHSDDNNLEVKSLPNLCSHINDFERSGSFQLSRSLQSNGKNNVVDPVTIENSGFPEQEPEGTGDLKQTNGPSELINKPLPDEKHADGLRIDSFSPFVELSLCRHLLSEGMGADRACKAFDAEKITLEKFRSMKESLIRNDKLVVRISGRYFPWHVAAPVVLGLVSFHEEQVFEPQGMIKVERVEPSTSQGSSWRIWPFTFRRTSTINIVQPVCDGTVETSLSIPVKESDKEINKPMAKRMERKVRSLTPTSEELASLDLREGKNVVTFTFSTAMLGRQQVDAHIYLWKWNTRIVISDVDGTITKSDVLGQFMPMVGVDWSQNGVTHLFSAIKENGYQLLFLSARSISQAHLTRQFLFNLKQDGKALPDGPVVISPDGLFPSLYREVIRRAPHEFKIACLEAIKALFPPDSHPFYAGFGNRDTDEFSYLKVGIPMGKIFIINPKGEVAVNRRVDTKSYTSLHALVNGMFPLISSSSEQEDYNTWNYWKMPLLTVD